MGEMAATSNLGVRVLFKLLIMAAVLTVAAVTLVYYLKTRDGSAIHLVKSSSIATEADTVTATATNEEKMARYLERASYYKSRILNSMKSDRIQVGEFLDASPVECTLLMATYKRVEMLLQVMKHYCHKHSPVSKVVLVWNDPETPVPRSVRGLARECRREFRVVTTDRNRITNRFRPQHLFNNTECVFFVDDDLIISWEDMTFAKQIWQRSKLHIVGFEGRTRTYSILKDGSYFYGPSRRPDAKMIPAPGSYAIMLPGFFVHRAYLEMLFDPVMVTSDLLDYVDRVMNCDDILFSMVVTRFLRREGLAETAGLALQPTHLIRNLHYPKGQGSFQGLMTRPDHYTTRSTCLQRFAQQLGDDALALTQLGIKKTVLSPRHFISEEYNSHTHDHTHKNSSQRTISNHNEDKQNVSA